MSLMTQLRWQCYKRGYSLRRDGRIFRVRSWFGLGRKHGCLLAADGVNQEAIDQEIAALFRDLAEI